jgi:transposase-like protein
MTEDRLPLNELLQKAGDGDFLRAVAESVLQLLMEADVEGLIGAGRHERAADRLNWRNGYRDRTLDTRLGSLNLKIPKLRAGIRQAFLQPDREMAGQLWRHVADQLRPWFEKLGRLMDEAEHDVLAYMTFASQHRTKLHSTNPAGAAE